MKMQEKTRKALVAARIAVKAEWDRAQAEPELNPWSGLLDEIEEALDELGTGVRA